MSLRVLQFSDIHFLTKPADQRIPHDDVRESVLEDLTSPDLASLGRVDAIIIAGDIAFSGKRSEYHLAADWLERVIAICGCPRGAILPVPGNHDVDRDRIKTSTKLVHRSLRSSGLPQATAELAALADANDPCLMDKLAEYQTFAASYGCFFSAPSKPSWVRCFPLAPNRTLAFHGLTTVQVCDEADAKDGMLVGRHQYIIPRALGVEQVVVMHHPLEWLKDRSEATQYLTSRARILIVGHEHVQDLQKITTPNGHERLILASGALTPPNAADPYIYRYNLLEFDTDGENGAPMLSVSVYPRIWSPMHTAFRRDYECLGGADCVTIRLRCPQYTGPLTAAPLDANVNPGDPNIELSRLRYLFWRRLDWRERMRVLMKANALSPAPEAPLPHAVEEEALRQAETANRLAQVWDAIMVELPEAEREVCPFDKPPTE